VKRIVRSIVIFWGISAFFLFGYLTYGFFTDGPGSFYLYGAVDGVASATAWLDSNADGIQNVDEKPLANVCIWHGFNPEAGLDLDYFCKTENAYKTDENGGLGEFLPGAKCSDVFIFAKAPDGLQATTNLAINDCSAKFGFVAKDVPVKQKIVSIDDFIQQRNLLTWLTRICFALITIAVSVTGTIWLQKIS
jgi:hypothetical protein